MSRLMCHLCVTYVATQDNGRGERVRADTPSPILLIPVTNIPSYVGRVWKTA